MTALLEVLSVVPRTRARRRPGGNSSTPALARYAHRAFGELSRALGVQLLPFGRTDGDSLLAVDESGRLLAVDHGGWWLLGDSPAAGLEALAHGHAPHRLEGRRWQWRLPRSGNGPVGDALRAMRPWRHVLSGVAAGAVPADGAVDDRWFFRCRRY